MAFVAFGGAVEVSYTYASSDDIVDMTMDAAVSRKLRAGTL